MDARIKKLIRDYNYLTETLEDVKMGWREFMLCYGNSAMATMIDKGGRRFWYNPKWNNIK